MRIKRWHAGKLIILWVWGGLLGAVLLHGFEKSSGATLDASLEFLAVILLLLVLSCVTWIWLGERPESATAAADATDEPSEQNEVASE